MHEYIQQYMLLALMVIALSNVYSILEVMFLTFRKFNFLNFERVRGGIVCFLFLDLVLYIRLQCISYVMKLITQ